MGSFWNDITGKTAEKAQRQAAEAQAKALEDQIAAMKQSELANTTVQVSTDAATVRQNVDENARINVENDDTLRRKRASLASTYNTRGGIYGSMTGKNILGG